MNKRETYYPWKTEKDEEAYLHRPGAPYLPLGRCYRCKLKRMKNHLHTIPKLNEC